MAVLADEDYLILWSQGNHIDPIRGLQDIEIVHLIGAGRLSPIDSEAKDFKRFFGLA
jgi:hypothetical protein